MYFSPKMLPYLNVHNYPNHFTPFNIASPHVSR